MENWKTNKLKLSDIKAKLIVLDFWGINCSACIKSIPKMEALQASFSTDIQIIMVTRDTKDAVNYRRSTSKLLKNTKLPICIDDKALYKYIVYSGLPTHVWIDSNRVIQSIGDGEYTTIENISKWLGHKMPKIKASLVYLDFDRNKPSFIEGNGRNFDKVQYYSVIMGRIDGIGLQNRADFKYDKKGKVSTIFLDNVPLLTMFRNLLLYENHEEVGIKLSFIWFQNRILYELMDSSLFFYLDKSISKQEWEDNRLFSYELKVPSNKSDKTFGYMRSDLERYFGMTAKIENRKVKCYNLFYDSTYKFSNKASIIIPDSILIGNLSTGGHWQKVQEGGLTFDLKKNLFYFKNVDGRTLVYFLNNLFRASSSILPIVYATEDDGKLYNIVLRGIVENVSNERQELDILTLMEDVKKFHLNLRIEEKQIPMMVIKNSD
jgi:thiol-disulfide isomerase/thioredoxin